MKENYITNSYQQIKSSKKFTKHAISTGAVGKYATSVVRFIYTSIDFTQFSA